jgi:hypothetical protein
MTSGPGRKGVECARIECQILSRKGDDGVRGDEDGRVPRLVAVERFQFENGAAGAEGLLL